MMRTEGSVSSELSRVEIEALDRLDLIAEEIDAGGEADLVAGCFVLARQIDVDDPAANGKITRHFDLFETVVAVLGEPDDQFLRLQFLARLEGANEQIQLLAGRDRDCISAFSIDATSMSDLPMPPA